MRFSPIILLYRYLLSEGISFRLVSGSIPPAQPFPECNLQWVYRALTASLIIFCRSETRVPIALSVNKLEGNTAYTRLRLNHLRKNNLKMAVFLGCFAEVFLLPSSRRKQQEPQKCRQTSTYPLLFILRPS